MIEVKNLTKTYRSPIKSGNFFKDFFARQYKENTALKNISFSIEPGELVGFIGPNGAGKTTTMKILSGILYPTKGHVKVLNETPFEKKYAFLRQIGFVMGQKNQLLWDLPAEDTFLLNKEIYEVEDSQYRKNIDELVEMLECKSFIKQPVKTLSLGQRMRVELISALIHRPKVLFLDEPTIGLDVFAQSIIVRFIKEYEERYGSTIMLTSHYMKDIQRLAHRVIVINEGAIIFDGELKKLIEKYSEEKVLRITVKRQPSFAWLQKKKIRYEYSHPVLTIYIDKKDLQKYLDGFMQEFDVEDLTIEDEPIEEIIKKVFKSS